MAYFDDLSSCTYHPGACDASSWASPLLAIGWVEASNPYTKGTVPGDAIDKLVGLAHVFSSNFTTFRGLHWCTLCSEEGVEDPGLRGSYFVMFIPGENEVFAAPGRIDHHILRHSYKPPERFLEAVMRCPYPPGQEYLAALDKANGGIEAPLKNWRGEHPRRDG